MKARILLTAPGSGSGKTMISIALMAALKRLGHSVSAYKCGPDYIDPMFHRKALGIPSSNLDPFFCDEDKLCSILDGGRDISIIEGVMGYYDGIGEEGKCSTYDVARYTKTPVILIVNPKGMYTSVAPLIKGFKEYKNDSGIVGVIFNNTSKMMYAGLKNIAESQGVKALGYLPYDEEIAVESRHLGLLTADEIEDIDKRIERLAEAAIESIDIQGIIDIARSCSIDDGNNITVNQSTDEDKVSIAVASDEAFSFIYDANIKALENNGGSIVYFSPIHDDVLPEGISGLYIPGGYPELYKEALSKNISMRQSIKQAIEGGMPTIAECGGFMYLGSDIDGFPMVGYIDMSSGRKDRLRRFGYSYMECDRDSLIARAGEKIKIHEFHYYDSTYLGQDYTITKASSGKQYIEGIGTNSLYAGYPHLYFDGGVKIAERFLDKAREYRDV